LAYVGETVTLLAPNQIFCSSLTDPDCVGIILFPVDVFSVKSLVPTVVCKEKKLLEIIPT